MQTLIKAFIILPILAAFGLSLHFAPQLPAELTSHWNLLGEPNGTMEKTMGLYFMPGIMLFLALILLALPHLDPLKKNIQSFKAWYHGFIALLLFFLLSIHLQIILWNLGILISPNVFFPISIGILVMYLGLLCEKTTRNWFIGIRTPWTMSSDKIWNKTHKIGGKLFMISGAIAMIGSFFPHFALLFTIIPIVLTTIFTIIYSYIQFQSHLQK